MAFNSTIKQKEPVKQTITCCEDNCNNTREWNGYGIKPKRCYACENKLKHAKQKENSQRRIDQNKSLLKDATLYDKNTRGKKQVKSRSYSSKDKTVASANNSGAKKTGKKRVKWEDKPLNKMVLHVQDKFCNPYIRARDISLFGRCISCNSGITQAGHRYCVGDFPGMRFLVNNIHGQEISCNHFKSGNIDAFDRGLRSRHGDKYTDDLKQQSLIYLRGGHKFYVFDVLEIGKTYKYLLENKIWIFTMEEFNKYRKNINN